MSITFDDSDFKFFKDLVVEAGSDARKIQEENILVKRKDDRSIVTQADLMVQDLLMCRISERYPRYKFIAEEINSGAIPEINDDTITAVIDPIDGTAMFSMYLPEWCVSVGIFCGYVPVYGFVYSPGCGMFFYNDDSSAYLNERPVRADRNMTIDNESNIFSASEAGNRFHIQFPGKIRNLGSTALHACLTIDNMRNRTLAFIGKSRLWDWAGSVPIIQKAGGRMKYMNGEDIDFRAVISNDYRLLDYVIVYNSEDFESVRSIFGKR